MTFLREHETKAMAAYTISGIIIILVVVLVYWSTMVIAESQMAMVGDVYEYGGQNFSSCYIDGMSSSGDIICLGCGHNFIRFSQSLSLKSANIKYCPERNDTVELVRT